MIVEYELRTHFPTRIGNLRFRVDDDGSVWGQKNRREPAGGDWEAEPQLLARVDGADALVSGVLERAGFFQLAPRYEGSGDDGRTEALRYSGARGPHAVVVDRAEVPAFRESVRGLLWALGIALALT